jgi:hypothetical protein
MAARLPHRPTKLSLAAAAMLPLLAGCGHGATASSACRAGARAALARALAVPTGAVAATAADDGQGLTSCVYRARPAGPGPPAAVSVTVDAAPQAYFRLERAAVEESQNFVQTHHGAPPANVPRLGLDADWFPTGSRLMTTDGTSLVIVAVDWPAGRRAEKIALASTIARAQLGRLRPAAAIPGSG